MTIKTVEQPKHAPSLFLVFNDFQRRWDWRAVLIFPIQTHGHGESDRSVPPRHAIRLEIPAGDNDTKEDRCQDVVEQLGLILVLDRLGYSMDVRVRGLSPASATSDLRMSRSRFAMSDKLS